MRIDRPTRRNHLGCTALVLFLLFSFLIAYGFAQAPASKGAPGAPSNQRSSRSTFPGGVRSMRGCITRNDEGQYFLVSQRGAKVQLKSTEDLATRVGQQVRASGAFVDATPATPNISGSTSRVTPNLHPEHEFRILKIEVLSETCSVGKKKK